jgi:hypothetical protein
LGACAREAVLPATFAGMFAFVEDPGPVFVTGTAEVNLQYEGHSGPVIWLSGEEAEALQEEVGLDGATYFSFDRPMEEGEDGEWRPSGSALDEIEFSQDGAEATVDVREFRGRLNAVGHRVELRCMEGTWYVIGIEMTWIS